MNTPPVRRSAAPSTGRFVLYLLMALSMGALAGQLLIDPTADNIASACIAFASSLAVLLYLLWTPALQTHPLSTFALFGFCVTTQLGALLGQTAYGTSLAGNLRLPLETFGMLAGFQLLAMLAHTGYRWVLSPSGAHGESLPRQWLRGLGLYATPSTGVLWFTGYVGLLAFLLGAGRESTFGKVMQGLSFLAWAPFLIPMYMLQFGEAYSRWRQQWLGLLFFAGLVVLLGLAANARQVMLSGFVTVGLFVLLGVMRSAQPVSGKRVLQVAVAGLVLAALSIPLSDLATAMVVARKARGSVSAVQMVQNTFHYWTRPEELANVREEQRADTLRKYDEHYFDNPLLARLVETKFHDNALYFASTLTQSDRQLLTETTLDMFWVALPDPVIRRLGIDIDKKALEFSIGDYLSHLSQGAALGSRRTGSMLAQGLGVAGPAFLAMYFAGCLLAFAAMDLLAFRHRRGQVMLSAVGMLLVWKLFQNGLSNDSLHAWLIGTVRNLPQNIVLFLLVAGVARALGALFGGSRPSVDALPAEPARGLQPGRA